MSRSVASLLDGTQRTIRQLFAPASSNNSSSQSSGSGSIKGKATTTTASKDRDKERSSSSHHSSHAAGNGATSSSSAASSASNGAGSSGSHSKSGAHGDAYSSKAKSHAAASTSSSSSSAGVKPPRTKYVQAPSSPPSTHTRSRSPSPALRASTASSSSSSKAKPSTAKAPAADSDGMADASDSETEDEKPPSPPPMSPRTAARKKKAMDMAAKRAAIREAERAKQARKLEQDRLKQQSGKKSAASSDDDAEAKEPPLPPKRSHHAKNEQRKPASATNPAMRAKLRSRSASPAGSSSAANDSDASMSDAAPAAKPSQSSKSAAVTPAKRSHKRKTPPAPSASDDSSSDSSASAVGVLGDEESRERSKVKHISHVQIGNFELACWYYSPYPDPYRTCKKLFLCTYCLKYCKELRSLTQHAKECTRRRPPGKLIYRDGRHSVYEVDGSAHKLYCQCLCLFAKLFIDHKTLYYDVDRFLFYILTETASGKDAGSPTSTSSSSAAASSSPASSASSSSSSSTASASSSSGGEPEHVVAYFSKEKSSPDHFNLSCILAFPQYQRRGYGKFLIALSYELSRREKKMGSPEKPLSELGRVSYLSFWLGELLHLLSKDPKNLHLSLVEICNLTSIKKEDVISALESVGFIKRAGLEHTLDVSPKQLQAAIIKARIKPATPAAAASASSASSKSAPLANGHVRNNSSNADKSKASKDAAAASSNSASSTQQQLEFKPELLQWRPPSNPIDPLLVPPRSHKKKGGESSRKRSRR